MITVVMSSDSSMPSGLFWPTRVVEAPKGPGRMERMAIPEGLNRMNGKVWARAARERIGMTQHDAAVLANLTVDMVKKYESEKYRIQPSERMREMLEHYLVEHRRAVKAIVERHRGGGGEGRALVLTRLQPVRVAARLGPGRGVREAPRRRAARGGGRRRHCRRLRRPARRHHAGGGTGHASHPHEQLISGEMAMYMPVSEEVTRVSSEKTVMDWS